MDACQTHPVRRGEKGAARLPYLCCNDALLTKALREAPNEISGQKGRLLSVPMPDGSFTRVRIQESPVLSPELQALHPEIDRKSVV